MHVRKNDQVMVVSGSEKGKQGKVLRVVQPEGKPARVFIEKLALVKKHTKPNQANRTGGIVEMERSIAIASILLICPKEDRPRRVKAKVNKDGKKIRVCAKCGEAFAS